MHHQFLSKIRDRLYGIANAIGAYIQTQENLEHYKCIVASEKSYRHLVNKKLTELAQKEYGIKMSEVANFTGIAEKSAHEAGLPNPETDALVLLDLVLTRQPKTTDLTNLSKDYARSTVLASLIRHLKTKGLSLKETMLDPKVKELGQRYSIRDQTIERYFNEDIPPNKEIDIERLWKAKGRSSLLENYDPKRGSFSSYLSVTLRNEARDLKRQIDRESDVLSNAIRIREHTSEEDEGIDPERNPAFAVERSNEVDAGLMASTFRRELSKRNPKYLELVRLIHSGDLDPTRERDFPQLQQELGMATRGEFLSFRNKFFEDLKQVFREIEASDSDARLLLRLAKSECNRIMKRQSWEQHMTVPKVGKDWEHRLGTQKDPRGYLIKRCNFSRIA